MKSSSSSSRPVYRVLSLNSGDSGEPVLYRLKKGWILRFRMGPTLFGRKVSLQVNLPEENDMFARNNYRLLTWSGGSFDDAAAYIDLPLSLSGCFRFYFTLDDSDIVQGDGYFVVDPELRTGAEGEKILPLDCIQCQTVLAKNLGPFSAWEDKINVSRESGYNFVHFTPVQELGSSNSAYSLSNQMKLNPNFKCSWDQIETFVIKMEKEWNILSICDIVLNHTANESEWIKKDPRITYNLEICPHLKPAYLLDRAIYRLSLDVQDGKWESVGIPKGIVNEEAHLGIIKSLLYDYYLPVVKIHEFYLADVDSVMEKFENKIALENIDTLRASQCDDVHELSLIPSPSYTRKGAEIDYHCALRHFYDDKDKEGSLHRLRNKLEELNRVMTDEIWNHINSGIDNVIKGARYHRVEHYGPRVSKCNKSSPLVCQYFTSVPADTLEEEDVNMKDEEKRKLMMAHNGWVMDYDPVKDIDFVDPKSYILLRRELIAWGDSVKLRYGKTPEDSPYLWNYMVEYVEKTARIFQGIRLDNCHSTPIHVAEYLLDKARLIRPNLYVIAELFTSSEASDNVFINHLGINSLIRENLNAYDSHELGRLIHRFGGEPVGAFEQLRFRPLVPSMAHAILFEQTHDNPSPIEKRSVYDSLTSAALISMACCATGSNRGLDEFVPHHIHVVEETRTYSHDVHKGMITIKKILNELHWKLGIDGFNECYVDQMDPDVVAITRHNKITHESVVMIAHTAFSSNPPVNSTPYLRPLEIEGVLGEIVVEAKVVKINEEKFVKDPEIINGLTDYSVAWKTHFSPEESDMVEISSLGAKTLVHLKNFVPGSIICFRFEFHERHSTSTKQLQKVCTELHQNTEFSGILNELKLEDFNYILFRCEEEERDASAGQWGVYVLDGYGPLKYAGLQGIMNILSEIRMRNDLGNWLPQNLRAGDWMLDYISDRLERNLKTKRLGMWYKSVFYSLKSIPRYLIPKYFDSIITLTYSRILEQIWSLMSDFVAISGSDFVRALALGSVIHGGVLPSVKIPGINTVSLAAGLPHFSTGYMRSWGRDTFISLRGFLILTGRYEEAKNIVCGFASCLRHGLIPNLLDGGYNARFNCRDAVWFWLCSIKDFVDHQGPGILNEEIGRLYPKDDSYPRGEQDWITMTLEEIMQEALNTHFTGLKFRERNAGTRIDAHMQDEGFNNEIGVCQETGFIFGGNPMNCGTWMDKMGSSSKANIKGSPATPRDGSAVEIIGLSYSVINWLSVMHESGHYKFGGVINENNEVYWSYEEWSKKIRSNFETFFWISRDSAIEKRPDLINKVGIYKDTLGSKIPWADYQLRPNFCIAMTVAPELFNTDHALNALEIVKTKLMGPLGLATLDPDDWKYRGDYDNSNDSEDANIAQGINYHQGPEWVWPMGYFLRAYLHFKKLAGKKSEAESFIKSVLSAHYKEIISSPWKGIPELTNSKGQFCKDSNPIQAWSMSCLLEVLVDLKD